MSFWNNVSPASTSGPHSVVTSTHPICSLGSLNGQSFGLIRPAPVLITGGNRSAVISDAVKSADGPVILINLDWDLSEEIMTSKSTSHSLIRMDWPETRGAMRDSDIATACVNPFLSSAMPPRGDQRILMIQLLTISLISARDGFWESNTRNLISAIFDLLLAEYENQPSSGPPTTASSACSGLPAVSPAGALKWINDISTGAIRFDPMKVKMLGCHAFTQQTLDHIIGSSPTKMRDAILTNATHCLKDFSEQALQKKMADVTVQPFHSSFEVAGRPIHPLIAIGHSGQGKVRSHLSNATATSLIHKMILEGDPECHKLVVIDNAHDLPRDEYIQTLMTQGRGHNTTILFATPDMNLIRASHDSGYASALEANSLATVRAELTGGQDLRSLTQKNSTAQTISFGPAISDLSPTAGTVQVSNPAPQTVIAKLTSLLSRNTPQQKSVT